MPLARVCVFCGSSPGADPAFAEAARALGRLVAARGLELLYGAGNVGLMGILADAALAAGGRVTGVIPRFLMDKELAHLGLTRLEIVDSMHERKARLAELADAFVALPGGMGTLEEVCEVTTWAQLALHAKPIGLLDIAGYYQPLLAFLDRAVAERLLRPEHRGLLLVESEPGRLLDRFAESAPAPAEKWIDRT
ncbi:MAG TPA: TIGR00730 family Rossman fold protein [Thermoanaerobaculia bacterium]|nr:TIGR00730 family Rossman fold protein [Thermoanaerobaculia bacterium]